MRRSMPRRYASAAARYCSRENSSVTLIGTPAKIASSIAGSPSFVPGILMKRLRRPARAWSSRAAASVVFVSYARSGETSSDTQPSTPAVRSKTGRNRSAARGEVVLRELEEERFAGLALPAQLARIDAS